MGKINLSILFNLMNLLGKLRDKINADLYILIFLPPYLSINKTFPIIDRLPASSLVLFFVSSVAYALCIQILFFVAQRYNTKSIMKAGVLVSGLGYGLYRQNLPILAGFALGIGSSIIASVWFYSLIDTRLTNFFQTEINDKPIHVSFFIKQINRWNEARTYRVMDTWTELLLGKVYAEFEYAIQISKNFKVEVLLANPYSKVIKQRSEDLKKDAFSLSEEGLSKLFDLYIISDSKLDIRLYNTTISCRAYSWYDKTFFSFYPPGRQGDHGLNLEFFNASPLGEYINKYFDEVWRSDKSININYHMMACINPSVSGEWEQSQEFMYCINRTSGDLYFIVKYKSQRFIFEDKEEKKTLVNLLIDRTVAESLQDLSSQFNINILNKIGCASFNAQIRKLDVRIPEEEAEEDAAIGLFRKRYGTFYLRNDLEGDPTVFKICLKSDR